MLSGLAHSRRTLGMSFSSATVADIIVDAARRLLSVCDGASSEDGAGFNKPDALRVRSLLSQAELSEADLFDLYLRLDKYKRQLLGFGVNYDQLSPPIGVRLQLLVGPDPTADAVLVTFGKYKGKSLGDLVRTDRGYVEWLAGRADFFDPYWPDAARKALAGEPVAVKGTAVASPPRAVITPSTACKASFTQIDERTIAVNFSPSSDLVERFKTAVDGRKWNPREQRWEFLTPQIVKAVMVFGGFQSVSMDAGALHAYEQELNRKTTLDATRTKLDSQIEIPGLLLPPFGYQRVGVEFFFAGGKRIGIFDDVGLGKTFQAIMIALAGNYKTLVICPAAVKLNWRKAIMRLTGLESTLWDCADGADGPLDRQLHITNFETFVRRKDEFIAQGFQLLVIDEAHYLGNAKSQRSLAIFGGQEKKKVKDEKGMVRTVIVKHKRFDVPCVVLLTATPLPNKPKEFFPLLNYLAPDRFPNFFSYAMKYGAFDPGNLKRLPSTPQNLQQLHQEAKDLFIRRLEHEVNADRPKKNVDELWVELDGKQRREYKRLLESLLGEWSESGKPTLAAMHPLREWLNKVKLPLVWDTIDELLAADKPVVLFSTRIEPLKQTVAKYGHRAALITGAMSLKKRQAVIDAFEAGQLDVVAISIRAGGTGIDGLQHRSHHMIFLDLDWVPALHHQAEGRLDRTGQVMPVQVWYALVEGTVDEYLRDIIARKLAVTTEVTDGKAQKLKRRRSVFKEFVQRLKRDYKKLEEVADADETEGEATEEELAEV